VSTLQSQLATLVAQATAQAPQPTATVDPAVATLQVQVATLQAAMAVTPASVLTSTGTTMTRTHVTDGSAVVTTLQTTQTTQGWELEYFTGATQLMKDFKFTTPDPTWKEFPNVDWPKGNFLAKNGLEYGKYIDEYCQQAETCDIVIPARSYRYITGDYNIAGIGECTEGGTGIGCSALLFNMGDVTASLEDQHVDAGFSVTGLYWNGDEVDQAISALASHVVYRMVGPVKNMPANPGANCSVPEGCNGVDIVFAILSGNELLVRGHTIVEP